MRVTVLGSLFGILAVAAGCSGDDTDTGRLMVQEGTDAMAAFFGGTILTIDSDGCTTSGEATIVWPLGTTWEPETRSVRLADGTTLVDGTVFDTGGGWLTLTDDEIRSIDGIDQATVTDETLSCGTGSDYLVIGSFEAVVDG